MEGFEDYKDVVKLIRGLSSDAVITFNNIKISLDECYKDENIVDLVITDGVIEERIKVEL